MDNNSNTLCFCGSDREYSKCHGAKTGPILAVAIIQDQKTGKFLLQHRDDNVPNSPDKWGLFGGHMEAGETPEIAVVRELEEEIGIKIDSAEPAMFDRYAAKGGYFRNVFLVKSISESSRIDLHEGQGYEWIEADKVFGYDLTDMTRDDLRKYLAK